MPWYQQYFFPVLKISNFSSFQDFQYRLLFFLNFYETNLYQTNETETRNKSHGKEFTASYGKQNINQDDYNRTSLRKRQTLGQQQKTQMTAAFQSRKMEERV